MAITAADLMVADIKVVDTIVGKVPVDDIVVVATIVVEIIVSSFAEILVGRRKLDLVVRAQGIAKHSPLSPPSVADT